MQEEFLVKIELNQLGDRTLTILTTKEPLTPTIIKKILKTKRNIKPFKSSLFPNLIFWVNNDKFEISQETFDIGNQKLFGDVLITREENIFNKKTIIKNLTWFNLFSLFNCFGFLYGNIINEITQENFQEYIDTVSDIQETFFLKTNDDGVTLSNFDLLKKQINNNNFSITNDINYNSFANQLKSLLNKKTIIK
ncbi:MAG: hypothetical protein ACRC4M_04035 [Mycoplasma sp.]